MRHAPNLARRPFANERPVRRLTLVLWSLGGLLTVLNGFLFYRYATSNVEGRDQLREVRAGIEAELETVEELRRSLVGFDLDEQNEEIRFLNRRIAERTFPWSVLFEQLGEVLPRGVRLNSLAPRLPEPVRGRSRVPRDPRVQLTIDGAARDGEELLAFVDGLFAHPAFESPDLERESTDAAARLVSFNLETLYRPSLPDSSGDRAAVAETAALEAAEGQAVEDVGESQPELAEREASRTAGAVGATGEAEAREPAAAAPGAGEAAAARSGSTAVAPTRARREPSATTSSAPARVGAGASSRPDASPAIGGSRRPARTEPRAPRPGLRNASSAPPAGRGGGR